MLAGSFGNSVSSKTWISSGLSLILALTLGLALPPRPYALTLALHSALTPHSAMYLIKRLRGRGRLTKRRWGAWQ